MQHLSQVIWAMEGECIKLSSSGFPSHLVASYSESFGQKGQNIQLSPKPVLSYLDRRCVLGWNVPTAFSSKYEMFKLYFLKSPFKKALPLSMGYTRKFFYTRRSSSTPPVKHMAAWQSQSDVAWADEAALGHVANMVCSISCWTTARIATGPCWWKLRSTNL